MKLSINIALVDDIEIDGEPTVNIIASQHGDITGHTFPEHEVQRMVKEMYSRLKRTLDAPNTDSDLC